MNDDKIMNKIMRSLSTQTASLKWIEENMITKQDVDRIMEKLNKILEIVTRTNRTLVELNRKLGIKLGVNLE